MSLPLPFTAPVPPDFLRDESRKTGTADAIAFPDGTTELAATLRAAAALNAPVTVQGARTGISAGAVPDGGVIVNLSRMDRILGFRTDPQGNAFLRAQPGVALATLRRHLADRANTAGIPCLFTDRKSTRLNSSH